FSNSPTFFCRFVPALLPVFPSSRETILFFACFAFLGFAKKSAIGVSFRLRERAGALSGRIRARLDRSRAPALPSHERSKAPAGRWVRAPRAGRADVVRRAASTLPISSASATGHLPRESRASRPPS